MVDPLGGLVSYCETRQSPPLPASVHTLSIIPHLSTLETPPTLSSRLLLVYDSFNPSAQGKEINKGKVLSKLKDLLDSNLQYILWCIGTVYHHSGRDFRYEYYF